ncbi:CatA-like O-acetyltransferase [Methanosarcina sp.]|nr:CatA-like O-acetyltransferase [Methanosarcina sp.]MDY9928166.1 CatA-like O-acetyltransferase [Methanosarcina sp.]
MFDWGKYHEREGKLMMPFAVQVYHAFVDLFILANLRINCRDVWMRCN